MLTQQLTVLPAADLQRVRTFYHDKFGLDPIEEVDGNLYMAAIKKRYLHVEAVPPGPAPDSGNSVRYVTHWKTNEGDVYVENHDNLLLVFESIDDANVNKLRDAIAGKQ